MYSFVWKMHGKYTKICDEIGVGGRWLYEQKRFKIFLLRFPYNSRAMLDILGFTERGLEHWNLSSIGKRSRGKSRTANEARIRESRALEIKKKKKCFSSFTFLFSYLSLTYILIILLLLLLLLFYCSITPYTNLYILCTKTCD